MFLQTCRGPSPPPPSPSLALPSVLWFDSYCLDPTLPKQLIKFVAARVNPGFSPSGLGERLSLHVPPWLRRRALREGHRRVRELAVPERRPLSERGERLPVPVLGRLFGKSLPGESRLPPLSQTRLSKHKCIHPAII